MSCQVRLYDSSFVDLCLNSIQIAAIDQGPPPVNCCPVQSNQTVRAPSGQVGCGADLAFNQGTFVYQIAIHDPSGAFAGTTLPDLNGNIDGGLDVVLYSAPPPGSHQGQIRAPASTAEVSVFIEEQPFWTGENKMAVRSVARGISSLMQSVIRFVEVDNVVFAFAQGYALFLDDRGIDPSIFVERLRV